MRGRGVVGLMLAALLFLWLKDKTFKVTHTHLRSDILTATPN